MPIFIFSPTDAQENQNINYLIKPDGTIEPDDSAIICSGNNYFLTKNISGSVTIRRDNSVFDGAGYTLMDNAIKETYNLDNNVLYLEAGFNLTNAWNVTIQNVQIENCVNGISLVNAYYCQVLNCSIIGNAIDGIKLVWSANNSIVWNNLISNSDDAIQVINSRNNNIMLNNLNSGTAYRINGNGLQLNGNSSNNAIKGNNVTAFDTGILIGDSNGNASANIVSYNNFINNKWNGVFITGMNNLITLNNFYNNGILVDVNNNCTGNYWNANPSNLDDFPRDTPIDTNIPPEFIKLPQTEPTPINSQSAKSIAKPTTNPTSMNSPSHTPKETTYPIIISTPIPSTEPRQTTSNMSILLIITVLISAATIAFVPLVLEGKIKGNDKKLQKV